VSYAVAFTRGFKEGLEVLPKEFYPIVNRQMTAIANDPYARDPNRTRMKNAPRTFRARVGIHVRMLYRVLDTPQEINFLGIGPRGSIYDRQTGGATLLSELEREALLKQLLGDKPAKSRKSAPESEQVSPELDVVEIEELEWICEDELFLLQIPRESWSLILEAGSVDGLQRAALDSRLKVRIEDYWTNPKQSQIEKLYTLSAGQGIETIAQRPLSEFLIMLDPEQTAALQKLKATGKKQVMNGPYLLKGSAGTGKSLIGLYHIRDLIVMRAGESLYDTDIARYGVVTYTNTLVEANAALLRAITPASAHAGIECTTLDKIAYHLVNKALGRTPNALNTVGMARFLRERVAPAFGDGSSEQDLLTRIGSEFIAEEIERSIMANGLNTIDDYVQLDRRGRKRGLRQAEREGIWTLYEALMRVFAKANLQTFEQWRLLALHYLRNHPEYPRFAAMFVDEAQDFSKVARQLCLELIANPQNLLLAADTGQSIYCTPPSWRQCDARFDFRARRPIPLSKSYRATWQIGQAIAGLRADPGDEEDHSNNASPVFSGPQPVWINANLQDHPKRVAELVAKLVNDGSNPIQAGLIAVIVRESGRSQVYASEIRSHGINCAIVEKGSPLKVDQQQVHIITAHSSKGLGFPVVIVPDVSAYYYPPHYLMERTKDKDEAEDLLAMEQRLLYVALSRASHQLIMLADEDLPSPLLAKLDRKAHWSSE
jgi:superfamily I DNA/RNA helicase/mRNA-degrading endonuclease RelE of RelBE toxin-antitoxin system